MKLHYEELLNLQNNIRIIKSRRMRWVEHVVHVGDFRNVYKILIREYKENNFLESLE
jgi:hypothetical protein